MKQKIGLFLCLALLLTGCSYQTKTIRFGAATSVGCIIPLQMLMPVWHPKNPPT